MSSKALLWSNRFSAFSENISRYFLTKFFLMASRILFYFINSHNIFSGISLKSIIILTNENLFWMRSLQSSMIMTLLKQFQVILRHHVLEEIYRSYIRDKEDCDEFKFPIEEMLFLQVLFSIVIIYFWFLTIDHFLVCVATSLTIIESCRTTSV